MRILAPSGALTVSRRNRIPARVTTPLTRTTGNGLNSFNPAASVPAGTTTIGSDGSATTTPAPAVLEAPPLSTTRSQTV
jgi:hypothetical protein